HVGRQALDAIELVGHARLHCDIGSRPVYGGVVRFARDRRLLAHFNAQNLSETLTAVSRQRLVRVQGRLIVINADSRRAGGSLSIRYLLSPACGERDRVRGLCFFAPTDRASSTLTTNSPESGLNF